MSLLFSGGYKISCSHALTTSFESLYVQLPKEPAMKVGVIMWHQNSGLGLSPTRPPLVSHMFFWSAQGKNAPDATLVAR